MKASIRITTTEKEMREGILNAMADHINKYLRRIEHRAVRNIRQFILQTIQNSEEYQSLLHGQLQAEFGIADPQVRLDSIIQTWLENIIVEFHKVEIKNSRLTGGFSIKAIQSNFKDVIDTPAAIVRSEGGLVLWLRWLLLSGLKVVVRDYYINYDLNTYQRQISRTHRALMFRKHGRGASKPSYRVPAQYSGTVSDNWISRLFETANEDIEIIILLAVEDYL